MAKEPLPISSCFVLPTESDKSKPSLTRLLANCVAGRLAHHISKVTNAPNGCSSTILMLWYMYLSVGQEVSMILSVSGEQLRESNAENNYGLTFSELRRIELLRLLRHEGQDTHSANTHIFPRRVSTTSKIVSSMTSCACWPSTLTQSGCSDCLR